MNVTHWLIMQQIYFLWKFLSPYLHKSMQLWVSLMDEKNPLKKKLCIGGGWAGVNYSGVISALRCAAGGTIYGTVSSICSELKTIFETHWGGPLDKTRMLKCQFNNHFNSKYFSTIRNWLPVLEFETMIWFKPCVAVGWMVAVFKSILKFKFTDNHWVSSIWDHSRRSGSRRSKTN